MTWINLIDFIFLLVIWFYVGLFTTFILEYYYRGERC